jgi:hypothetical protein
MSQNKRPGIPAIDPNLPLGLQQVLQPMKESIEISLGVRSAGHQVGSGVGYAGWSRRSVTLGMLVKLGVITEAQAISVWQDP